jgi:hypothetical protein
LPAEHHTRVDEHVRGCPECQRQAGEWRKTIGALDTWKVPERARPAQRFTAYARWAVAAAAVLGLGWMGGRLSVPEAATTARLRAEILPALKQELRQEFQTSLAAAIKETDDRNRTVWSNWHRPGPTRARRISRPRASINAWTDNNASIAPTSVATSRPSRWSPKRPSAPPRTSRSLPPTR